MGGSLPSDVSSAYVCAAPPPAAAAPSRVVVRFPSPRNGPSTVTTPQKHRLQQRPPIATKTMWRRAGVAPLRLHLVAAAGRRVRRCPLPPPPTIPPSSSSSSAASSSSHHDLGIFRCSVGAPYRALSSEAAGGGCWNCGSAGAFLSCGSCGSVQPVDPDVDYFQIFGLERKYDILENNLEGKYKDWQKKLHPDLVHTKSEKERGFAAEQSALVIDAYRTLSRPLSRALYLLKLEGIQVDEEKTINDPELLMEMMEIREAVSDTTDSETLENIQSQIKRKLETWSNSFQEAFGKRDFNRAVEATQRMRYYERAVEETVKKL